jgi:hypothetical protein
MLKKILYFGSGTHIEPVCHFPETTEFIFGDSLPKNSHGFDYYSRVHYEKYFMLQLEEKIKNMNLSIIKRKILTNKFDEINIPNLESQCLFISDKNSLDIKYYVSTSLPYDLYDNKDLQMDIGSCDTLLISGYYPDKKIIKYIEKPFNLIGYSSTYFPQNINQLTEMGEMYENNVLPWIINNPHSIKMYIAVDRETGEKYHYENYGDFVNCLEFISKSKTPTI